MKAKRQSDKLTVLEAEPLGAGIIERLERALEMAKRGELSSIAIALVYRDGCAGSVYSEPPSMTALIGSIARLQYRLMRANED